MSKKKPDITNKSQGKGKVSEKFSRRELEDLMGVNKPILHKRNSKWKQR